MLLGRRRPSGRFASVASTASEPHSGFGAAPCRLRSPTESTSGHAARGNRAGVHNAGNREKIRSSGWCVS
jgi:hypothetical protein